MGRAYRDTGNAREKPSNQGERAIVQTGQTQHCFCPRADGSCFSKLIPVLQAEGHDVIAAQHGLDALASDVAAVRNTLGRVRSPVILVGHSYGGTLITAAGTDPRVAGLVYIAALAPDAHETSQSLQAKVSRHGS